jgi:hypothetical protein
MRRRIAKTLVTTAAAGAIAGFAAASPAGAVAAGTHSHHTYFSPSGGTPIPTNANCSVTPSPADNCAMAGYQASGRNFRFAQALITVPNHDGIVDPSSGEADPTMYVALDNTSGATYEFARVGIAPCPADELLNIIPDATITCPGSGAGNTTGWVAFSAVEQPTGTPTIDLNVLPSAAEGDGILVNAYLVPADNAVHFTITLPNGTVINHQVGVAGPVYTKAVAVADWTTANQNEGGQEPLAPSAKVRDLQFFQGRFTTVSGAQGTFKGPWTVTALEGTSNGSLPPAGTVIAQPSYLWNDGNSFKGLGNDAFGVWRFPF